MYQKEEYVEQDFAQIAYLYRILQGLFRNLLSLGLSFRHVLQRWQRFLSTTTEPKNSTPTDHEEENTNNINNINDKKNNNNNNKHKNAVNS
jgi:hypothetical protein